MTCGKVLTPKDGDQTHLGETRMVRASAIGSTGDW